jgi:hypothetical protein
MNYNLLPLGHLLMLIDGEITEEQAEAIIKRKQEVSK